LQAESPPVFPPGVSRDSVPSGMLEWLNWNCLFEITCVE